jgi:hypothetical protein
MAHRTTLLLDSKTQTAARELAARMQVSVSEAIRRAILEAHSRGNGVSDDDRLKRKKALAQLVESFKNYDPQNELAALADNEEF